MGQYLLHIDTIYPINNNFILYILLLLSLRHELKALAMIMLKERGLKNAMLVDLTLLLIKVEVSLLNLKNEELRKEEICLVMDREEE